MEQCVSTAVLLAAAGNGQRMGGDVPKQFMPILNRPLISYTIEAYESFEFIDVVLVVIQREEDTRMRKIIHDYQHQKVQIAYGESTRLRSIQAGLNQLYTTFSSRGLQTVIINDAVRPLVDKELLQEMITATNEFGACGVTRPLVSTVLKQTPDGVMQESLDRPSHCASEMPQAFRFQQVHKAFSKIPEDVVDKALDEASHRASESPQAFRFHHFYQAFKMLSEEELENGTECLHVAQKYANINAKLLPGGTEHWKVTHRKDTYAIEGLLKEQQCREVTVLGVEPANRPLLAQYFHRHQVQLTFSTCQECSCNNLVVVSHSAATAQLLPRYVGPFLQNRSLVQQARYIGIIILVCINDSETTESQIVAQNSQNESQEKATTAIHSTNLSQNNVQNHITNIGQSPCTRPASNDVIELCASNGLCDERGQFVCTVDVDVTKMCSNYAQSLKERNVIFNSIHAAAFDARVLDILREILFNRSLTLSGQTFHV